MNRKTLEKNLKSRVPFKINKIEIPEALRENIFKKIPEWAVKCVRVYKKYGYKKTESYLINKFKGIFNEKRTKVLGEKLNEKAWMIASESLSNSIRKRKIPEILSESEESDDSLKFDEPEYVDLTSDSEESEEPEKPIQKKSRYTVRCKYPKCVKDGKTNHHYTQCPHRWGDETPSPQNNRKKKDIFSGIIVETKTTGDFKFSNLSQPTPPPPPPRRKKRKVGCNHIFCIAKKERDHHWTKCPNRGDKKCKICKSPIRGFCFCKPQREQTEQTEQKN